MGTRDVTARLHFHQRLLVRTAGFVLAVVTIGGALAVGSVLRHPVPHAQPAVAAVEEEKDQTRVADARGVAAMQAASTITNVSVWHPGKMEHASPGKSMEGPGSASEPKPSGEWQDKEFTAITIIDGRTFASDGLTLRLAGLELPAADQVCRTLDDRLEQCATRAATQLELITRSRTLVCRYQMITSSEALGACRIGAQDLAQRLARTAYVRATDTGKTVMATASR